MGRALLSVATQDVIQLQQLPLSVSQFDDTGRICNDDECFLRSLLTLWVFFFFLHSEPPHLPSLGDSTPAIQVLSGGGGFIRAQPCVCSLWSAVCVNTERSAHRAAVWTARKVDTIRCGLWFFVVVVPSSLLLGLDLYFENVLISCVRRKTDNTPRILHARTRDGCTDQVQFFRQEHPGFA